jgi:hypothetical protein
MAKDLIKRPGPETTSSELPHPYPELPKLGEWYMVLEVDDDGSTESWLGCVMHVGSNYAEIHGLELQGGMPYRRVHFDIWHERCQRVLDPDSIIKENIHQCQEKVSDLLERVKYVTAQLAISPTPQLAESTETKALALRSPTEDMGAYKTALVKAKKELLPDLFKEIKEAHKELASWMSAQLLPLKAQTGDLEELTESIDNRIFSVELYAGLIEEMIQAKNGKPADLGEKIRLLQRRCYMDEECLAQYQTGGMDIKSLKDFDRWLAKPANLNRLLPFPRCIVAFQVRRHDKERVGNSLSDYIRIFYQAEADKATFLYIRNGEQLYRLSTGIDFGEKLFPDMDHNMFNEKLWGKTWNGGKIDKLITDNEYQALIEDLERKKAEAEEQKKTLPKEERWQVRDLYFEERELREYKPFDPSSVYYDDIAKHIGGMVTQHNRVALVVQGLLDRSPALHPHPPWTIWTTEGFQQALELVYDDSRALTTGEEPCFEAYRDLCNESLKVGSITVGQEDAWERDEADKENERESKNWRVKHLSNHTHFRPFGDPGPGTLARVAAYAPRVKKCTYRWQRERRSYSWNWENKPKHIDCTFTTGATQVLNVDAYKPGDFHIFFDDPRTRADYLKWAPMLLEAEEYHAGNRKVGPKDD